MVSSWGGIPKGSVPAPKHHQVAGPERPAGATIRWWGLGEGRAAPAQPTDCSLNTKNPFRVIGWQGSSKTFLPRGVMY